MLRVSKVRCGCWSAISTLVGTAIGWAAVPADSPDAEHSVRLACIGDSITEGSGATQGMSYPDQLQMLLGDEWKVGNFGVGGRTLLKKGDFPYWDEKAYRDARAFRPAVVIILLGTNDTKPQNWKHQAEFVANYRELVQSFLDLESKPKVLVCRPCPVPEPGNFGICESRVTEVIKRIDRLAEELNLSVIDMHAALKGKPEMLPDRVHPNNAGAAEMAKAAFAVLTTMVVEP